MPPVRLRGDRPQTGRGGQLKSIYRLCCRIGMQLPGRLRSGESTNSSRSPIAHVAATPQNPLREESKFTSSFNADSPVQSLREKYSSSSFQKYMVHSRRPALILGGAWRSSRTWSAGCDGRGGVAGRAMLARFRQNCGGPVPGLSRVVGGGVRVQQSRVVLASRRWCQACAKPGFARRWGQESPDTRARYKLSNRCAGKAGIVPTMPVVPSPCFQLCTGAAGVADTRPSLRPLQSRGRYKQQLGRDVASRERERSCQRLFEILHQHMFRRASRPAQGETRARWAKADGSIPTRSGS
jgi:hypothetical protein